jgi:hypothetical protein
VGVDNIYIDGSFVEQKDRPGDIDGYYECASPQDYLEKKHLLQAIDPIWEFRTVPTQSNLLLRKTEMWNEYRVELYPHYGNLSGIRDRFGNSLTFPAAFRKRKNTDLPKGIIKLKEG